MREKRKWMLSVFVVMLSAVLLSGCGGKKENNKSVDYGEAEVSENDTDWQQVENGETVLKNGRLEFVMNADTTHFVLTDLENGLKYYSAVGRELEGAKMSLDGKAQSELYVCYYDSNSQKQEMYSHPNSVAFDSYKILTNGEAIRVYYTMQLQATPPFVPQVLSEEMYQAITEKLDSTSQFKFKLMYKYYPVESVTTEAKEIRAKYPYAKKYAIYVLNSGMNDSDKNALGAYMEQAGYTQKQYEEDLEEQDIVLSEDDVPMQYTVPVEYRLAEDGFTVKVLSDLITASNEDYTLQSVSVLPYFNCETVADENGFILLPDGSGSVMKMDRLDNAGYSQRIYGIDMACVDQLTPVNSRNAVMPLLGYSSVNGSWLSYIEGAEEMAIVNAYRAGETEYCAHGYASFDLRGTDSFTMRKSETSLAVFSKNMCVEQPYMRYVLLGKQAGLGNMANHYRDYLQDKGKIQNGNDKGDMNLYLEFTGYMIQEASFLGINYDKKIVLSTLKDIITDVKKLSDAGVEHIYVRLSGYSDAGGKYHGIESGFSLDSAVGSIKELKELGSLLAQTGGGLYLEDDFMMVYRDTRLDDFSSTSDSIRRLDKTLADVNDYNIVTGKNEEPLCVRYLISPKLYESLAGQYRSEFEKVLGDSSISISSAQTGRYLISDFNEKNEFDRVQTANALKKTLEILKGDKLLMCDVGNSYVLGYADHILNMPLSDSNFVAEDYSVSFYQMALYGNVEYAGEAVNLSRNQEKEKFDTLLTGAGLYYSCVTDQKALETLNGEQTLYPVAFDVVYDEIVGFYNEHKELYTMRAGKLISDYEQIREGVFRIEYGEEFSVIYDTLERKYMIEGK